MVGPTPEVICFPLNEIVNKTIVIPPLNKFKEVYRNQSIRPSVCPQHLLNLFMDFLETLHKGSTQYVDLQDAINFCSAPFMGRYST